MSRRVRGPGDLALTWLEPGGTWLEPGGSSQVDRPGPAATPSATFGRGRKPCAGAVLTDYHFQPTRRTSTSTSPSRLHPRGCPYRLPLLAPGNDLDLALALGVPFWPARLSLQTTTFGARNCFIRETRQGKSFIRKTRQGNYLSVKPGQEIFLFVKPGRIFDW